MQTISEKSTYEGSYQLPSACLCKRFIGIDLIYDLNGDLNGMQQREKVGD